MNFNCEFQNWSFLHNHLVIDILDLVTKFIIKKTRVKLGIMLQFFVVIFCRNSDFHGSFSYILAIEKRLCENIYLAEQITASEQETK